MCHSAQTIRGSSGVSLIELMVALLLGIMLVIGAVTMYAQCQRTVRTLETTARLQEVARLAFDVLENDIRMAGYWGLVDRAEFIANRPAPGKTTRRRLRRCRARGSTIAEGTMSNWAIDLERYLDGSNNGYGLTCGAFGGDPCAGSDTLVIRRGGENRRTPRSTRRGSTSRPAECRARCSSRQRPAPTRRSQPACRPSTRPRHHSPGT